MTALPTERYRDPALVVADDQVGDLVPRGTRRDGETCATCAHRRPAVLGRWQRMWPCRAGCMPSPTTGGCSTWEAGQ